MIETESDLDSFTKIFRREMYPATKKNFQFQLSTSTAKLLIAVMRGLNRSFRSEN